MDRCEDRHMISDDEIFEAVRQEHAQKAVKINRRIHKLVNSDDTITSRQKRELRQLLKNSAISNDGLIDLVCDLLANRIKPLGLEKTLLFASHATKMLQSIRGEKDGKKSRENDPNVLDTKMVEDWYLKCYRDIKAKRYVSSFLVNGERNTRTGGLDVFAEEQAAKYGISADSIRSNAPKWRKKAGIPK